MLYSFVPVLSLAGYLPQVRLLIVRKEKAASVSLSSWLLWLSMASISLGYGVFCLEDFLFSISCAMNFLGCFTVVALVLYRRRSEIVPKINALRVKTY